MIDIRKLKELVRLMVVNDLVELDVRDENEQVTIKRPNPSAAPTIVAPGPTLPQASAPIASAASASTPSNGTAEAAAADPSPEGTVAIESPMVGTFYTASGPGKPPFVQVGAKVGPDTIVCLIEAMKIFNEIKAEMSGTVEAILVKNGQAVEFGQPLLRVRPD